MKTAGASTIKSVLRFANDIRHTGAIIQTRRFLVTSNQFYRAIFSAIFFPAHFVTIAFVVRRPRFVTMPMDARSKYDNRIFRQKNYEQ